MLTRTRHELIEDQSSPVGLPGHAYAWTDGGARGTDTIAWYAELPFMHKRLILACTVLGMLAGWLAIIAWPRSYESAAKLMIRVGRESVSLDPSATTSATLSLQKTQEEETISALEVLNSRQVAETVVDELGTDVILSGKLSGDSAGQSPPAAKSSAGTVFRFARATAADSLQSFLLLAGVKDDISDRELAVREVQSSVDIHSPRKSNVIVIQGQAKTPELAQAIVSKVTRSFMDEHLKSAHTDGSLAFFKQQSADVENELNELVKQRSDFMQKHEIVSINGNRELLTAQLSGLDRDLVVASGELEQAVAEVADLESKVADAQDEVVALRAGGADSTWSGMRQRIYDLELEEQALQATSTDAHPKLKRVREQLAGARSILNELKSERVDESMAPNPLKTILREELQRQQTKIVGLRSIIQEKKQTRAQIQQAANQLMEQERELLQTERNVLLLENSLNMMREKLEEARVIDELNSEKISNIHVFQPATFVERAVSPQKKLLAFGFVFLGFTTGLGLSFLREASSQALRTRADVEAQLCCPVVATIPQSEQIASSVPNRQDQFRRKCQPLITDFLLSRCRAEGSRGRSLGVIGVDVGAGASTLAANLALASSVDCRLRTVLVDADARQRSISEMFGLDAKPGLGELVSGSASHDECLQRVKNTPIDVIVATPDSFNDASHASAAEIVQALEAYLQDTDLLIVDLPAASHPDQAIALAQQLDCVLVVVESERTQVASADRLLRRLSESNTEVVGVVLNKAHDYLPALLRRCVAPQV